MSEHKYVSGVDFAYGISNTAEIMDFVSDAGDSFVISWILAGSGSYTEAGKTYPITDGCVCIRRHDRVYRFRLDEAPSVRLYLDLPICFYESLTLLIPELAHIPPVRPAPYRRETADEFISLISAFDSVDPTGLYQLLPRVISFILDVTGINADRAASPMTLARSLLSDISHPVTIEEVAERCEMNYNTFRKRFTDTYGISPYRFRTSGMIEAACQALVAGESIAEIAERLGFTDVYSFTHRFTSVVGESPARYRKRKRG